MYRSALIGIALAFGCCVYAQTSLKDINVAVPTGSEELQIPAQVLSEEIARRTGIVWKVGNEAGSKGAITYTLESDLPPEGFRISTDPGDVPLIGIYASTKRGAMFATGYLLRTLDWSKGKVALPGPINATESPEYAIRGHQLGYRPKANSYDAWDDAMYDQYIRELTFFGTNCIENIPFQDDRQTPIMPLSRQEMNLRMAEICDKYDVDYWVWTPADFDLTDQARRAEALAFHEDFYRNCPRLDAIFLPGGDPGHNHPRDVMPYLEDLAKILPKYHPDARIWLSLQGFDEEKIDYLFAWLDEEEPEWLGGLVGGPSSPPLETLRSRLKSRYQLRDYPDITHIVRCQYPELNLDQVFALTAGREPINPRPEFYTAVFRETQPHTNGFLSYSDGCHDDVNKAIWSALGWDSKRDPRDILVEYARCFFGPDVAGEAADGILAIEKNWSGALRENSGIPKTLAQWQGLEAAHPELANNWRWQMLLLRAYYDAYQQERLAYETALEHEANAVLSPDGGRLPTEAIEAALQILSRAKTDPIRPDLRARLFELFDALYENIKFQTSVEKYFAIHPQRACMLDFMDFPLNNRYWLEDELFKVRTLPDLEARWARLGQIRTWEDPGPGSFYDDIGNIGESPRATRHPDRIGDSGSYWWWDNGMSRVRLSWLVTGYPGSLEYEGLDSKATYLLRFSGFGDLKPLADGQALESSLYETENHTLKEYPVPQDLLNDGKLSVTFDYVRLEGVNWRYQPRLAEAWLIKQ